MKSKLAVSSLMIIGLFGGSVPLFAHHGNASYGHAKQITLKGSVTEWVWLNPHAFLKMDVKGDGDKVVNWVVEWNAPSSLINSGITRATFKPGDEVTVVALTPDNGAPVGRVQRAQLPNGKWIGQQTEDRGPDR